MIRTGYSSDDVSYNLDGYDIYEINNVKSIQCHHRLFDKSMYPFGWDVVHNDTTNSIEHYYFCIDTLFQDAFAHWVFESGIYLVLFKKLKNLYPNIKLYCKEIKTYKLAFLKGFGFNETDITTCLEENNKVFFPRYQSFHIFFPNYTESNDTTLDINYPKYLNNFHNYLVTPHIKDIDILYLPRGTKENYKGCDRIINIQDKLIDYISNKENCKVYYTDNTNNIMEQVELLQRSKIIILDYGSSLNVNAFLANNSKIIVLGYDIHHEMQKILNLIYNESIKRNSIQFIHKKHVTDTTPMTIIFDYDEVVNQIEKTFQETLLHTQEN